MSALEDRLNNQLQQREAEGALRKLPLFSNKLDFCSNDYLGLASSQAFKKRIQWFYSRFEERDLSIGATGSRLISGNSKFVETLEEFIAHYHKADAGLIFNSGYATNVGLLSCVPQRGDTILYDELVHASIRDGIRLSFANNYSFRHNNIEHLTELIEKAEGEIFIVVESLYSMDGDFAPLKEIVSLKKKRQLNIIVDEAHASGIYGPQGEGLCVTSAIENEIFARIITFGKALGCHGAIVIGSATLRNYLINYSRAFIYTTALSTHAYIAIKCVYDILPQVHSERTALADTITLFKELMNKAPYIKLIPSNSQIQGLLIPGNDIVKEKAKQLQLQGYDVRPILSPTVPKGTERIRICLHSFNTADDIKGLARTLYSVME